MNINYIKGDATAPIGGGCKYIIHICNDKGVWEEGFVKALSKKWSEPERVYRELEEDDSYDLGSIGWAFVGDKTVVINMIGQHGTEASKDGEPPIRYDALKSCMEKVGWMAVGAKASVHLPKIGTGYAGGDWGKIEKMIKDILIREYKREVFVYEL